MLRSSMATASREIQSPLDVEPTRSGALRLRTLIVGKKLALSMLFAGAVLTGCGGSAQTSTSAGTTASARRTGSSSEIPSAASLGVSIPSLLPEAYLPKRYTCDGSDISPPVRWNGIPRGTEELALFVANAQPVDGHVFLDWAVASLEPTSRGISAGRLPAGAVVGRNSAGSVGYSICPKRGGVRPAAYVVKLVALPRRLVVKPGFDASAFYNSAEEAPGRGAGFAVARYRRR